MVTVNYIRSLNIDEPLARLDMLGGVRFYHTDALGSVIALTDELGEVRTQYNYSPFGTVEVMGEESDNPFQYTGRENDGTGLMYYRARYYSPEMKRFISEDPIGFAGGQVNLYAYVGNSPLNYIDPQGLIIEWYLAAYYAAFHYSRNYFNEADEYEIKEITKEWEKQPAWKTVFHNIGPGNAHNIKYVSRDGEHNEAIINECGELVTDPANMGTYNLFGSKVLKGIPHFIFDVLPYLAFGNALNDPTTIGDRLELSMTGLIMKKMGGHL